MREAGPQEARFVCEKISEPSPGVKKGTDCKGYLSWYPSLFGPEEEKETSAVRAETVTVSDPEEILQDVDVGGVLDKYKGKREKSYGKFGFEKSDDKIRTDVWFSEPTKLMEEPDERTKSVRYLSLKEKPTTRKIMESIKGED